MGSVKLLRLNKHMYHLGMDVLIICVALKHIQLLQ